MGYSCTAIAKLVEDALMEIVRDGESSNSWRGHFTERGRENADGAITGTVWKMIETNRATRYGSYKITADGKIVRFAGTTADERKLAEQRGRAKFAALYPTFVNMEA